MHDQVLLMFSASYHNIPFFLNYDVDYFSVEGDDGVPSIAAANMAAMDQNHVAKEFIDSTTTGYAFLDAPDADEQSHVYLRYVLEWQASSSPIRLIVQDNRLNIVVVKESDVSTDALNRPISALTSENPGGGAHADRRELMRANPSSLVPASMNGLSITGTTYFYGMYYLKLATIESPNTPTGLFIDQFIHDDIIFSLTNVGANGSKSGFGSA